MSDNELNDLLDPTDRPATERPVIRLVAGSLGGVCMFRVILAAAALVGGLAAPAFATEVLEGDVHLGSGDLIQSGRLIRNGIPQDFAGSEPFPGSNNATMQFHYRTIDAPFAPNALQDVYYLLTFDDDVADLFASAYDGSYDPNHKQINWLGDAGQSGNYIFYPNTPGDALSFGVKVIAGGSLKLVVNDTVAGLGTSSNAHYLVQAFSDVDYDEDFAASSVPEPTTWAMMIGGFGIVGAILRRRLFVRRRLTGGLLRG